jgi:hypothetical protein
MKVNGADDLAQRPEYSEIDYRLPVNSCPHAQSLRGVHVVSIECQVRLRDELVPERLVASGVGKFVQFFSLAH